jgi:hypothetical protein
LNLSLAMKRYFWVLTPHDFRINRLCAINRLRAIYCLVFVLETFYVVWSIWSWYTSIRHVAAISLNRVSIHRLHLWHAFKPWVGISICACSFWPYCWPLRALAIMGNWLVSNWHIFIRPLLHQILARVVHLLRSLNTRLYLVLPIYSILLNCKSAFHRLLWP